MTKEYHSFRVQPDKLSDFLDKVQQRDEMQGNTVERVDRESTYYLVLISRQYSYPYIINRLRELEKDQ